jgi:predicted CopG family antitoxin
MFKFMKVNGLQSENENYSKKYSDVLEQLDRLKNENESLRVFEKQMVQLKSTQDESNSFETVILEAQEQHKNLESNFNEWKLANEFLEKAILQQQETHSNLAEKLDQLSNSNNDKNADILIVNKIT